MTSKKIINEKTVEKLARKTSINFGPTWRTQPVICPYCLGVSEHVFKSPKKKKACVPQLHEWTCLDCRKVFGIRMPKFTKTLPKTKKHPFSESERLEIIEHYLRYGEDITQQRLGSKLNKMGAKGP